MRKLLFFSLFIFTFSTLNAQVIINELDADTDGVDDKEFIEFKTPNPNTPLDGYIMVLFNGSSSGGNSSYYTFNLDGLETDFNGLLVLGGPELDPAPNVLLPINVFQNGADAVAVYQGDESDFPDQTLATTNNLIDALVYDTDDSDDIDLMNLLGVQAQINEDENNNKDFESIQRNNDGSWFVATPTPRVPNDGSGVTPIFINAQVSSTNINESESFDITFTASEVLSQDLSLNFTLANAGFNQSDYIGDTSVTITSGTTSETLTIQTVDDNLDEGDEFVNILIAEPAAPYVLNANNIEVIIVDDDFQVANYGTPLNPTFGIVSSTAPENYYASIEGLSDQNLINELQAIIAEEGVVKTHSYADIYFILEEADVSPLNSNKVWLIYSEIDKPVYEKQTGSASIDKWNREHVFPRSKGGFFSIDDDDIANGINVFWNTTADSLRHGNSDAHHLRPALSTENSSRGNQNFGEYVGPTGNQGSFKGDVARAVFYMQIRYNGLEVVNGFPTTANAGQIGDLQTLLDWHEQDPPDDYEMNRNNVIYNWQTNRNPFIDYPELVDYIWGDKIGQAWDSSLSTTSTEIENVKLYPNPSTGRFSISTSQNFSNLKIYNVSGQLVYQSEVNSSKITLNPNLSKGVYFIQLSSEEKSHKIKLIMR